LASRKIFGNPLCIDSTYLLFAGLWIIFKWKEDKWSHTFAIILDDDYNVSYNGEIYKGMSSDYCDEVTWAARWCN
jgi:hypothetical protein